MLRLLACFMVTDQTMSIGKPSGTPRLAPANLDLGGVPAQWLSMTYVCPPDSRLRYEYVRPPHAQGDRVSSCMSWLPPTSTRGPRGYSLNQTWGRLEESTGRSTKPSLELLYYTILKKGRLSAEVEHHGSEFSLQSELSLRPISVGVLTIIGTNACEHHGSEKHSFAIGIEIA